MNWRLCFVPIPISVLDNCAPSLWGILPSLELLLVFQVISTYSSKHLHCRKHSYYLILQSSVWQARIGQRLTIQERFLLVQISPAIMTKTLRKKTLNSWSTPNLVKGRGAKKSWENPILTVICSSISWLKYLAFPCKCHKGLFV